MIRSNLNPLILRLFVVVCLTMCSAAAWAHLWFYTFPYDGASLTGTWGEVKAFSEEKDAAYWDAYTGRPGFACKWVSEEPVDPPPDPGIFVGDWGGSTPYGTTCTGYFSVKLVAPSCTEETEWVAEVGACVPFVDPTPPAPPPPGNPGDPGGSGGPTGSSGPTGGESPGDLCLGNPIYPLRGVKRELVNTGLRVGAMTLRLTYDSTLRAPGVVVGSADANPGILGPLWSSTLHRKVQVQASGMGALVSQGNGYTVSFAGDGHGNYSAPIDSRDRLFTNGSGFRYFNAATLSEETYDAMGNLSNIFWFNGEAVTLIYSDTDTAASVAPGVGFLIQARDSKGRSLGFVYNLTGRLTQISDTAGKTVSLSYDSHGNLSQLIWTDGSIRTYLYENASYPWALTGVSDENSTRYSTFGYDSDGRAISTEYIGGVGRYSTGYDVPPRISISKKYDSGKHIVVRDHIWKIPHGTVAITPLGSSASIGSISINGKAYMTSQSQPAGSGCAASTSNMAFDANGNIARRDDFNGYRTCYQSDLTRNLETTRIEGLANTIACDSVTSAAAALPAGSRKISTQWHPDWSLATYKAEPGKFTVYVYNGQPDPLSGGAIASCAPSTALLPDGKPIAVLCKQVEQATTDADGHLGFTAALQAGVPNREQKWTYNDLGQVLTHDGPRTDIADITTYAYYDDTTADHTMGDLKSVTNALGQVIHYSKYNPYGQLLESIDPNGVVTTRTYDLRQRLLSTSVNGYTTRFTYDTAGQLLKVTAPDASWVGYEYDSAHRLIAAKDNLGNRIDYTLDNAGNRTAEVVKDPGGALRRQLSRSIDALGRTQQIIGRE